jgi:hypothetical protein
LKAFNGRLEWWYRLSVKGRRELTYEFTCVFSALKQMEETGKVTSHRFTAT